MVFLPAVLAFRVGLEPTTLRLTDAGGLLIGSRDVACGVCWVVSEDSMVLLVAVTTAVRWSVHLAGAEVRAQERALGSGHPFYMGGWVVDTVRSRRVPYGCC